MRRFVSVLHSERGHMLFGIASTVSLAGAALLAIGLGTDTTALSVAGAVALGISTVGAVYAPHVWLRNVYRRLDKLDPEDHEAMPEKRIRIPF